MSWPIHLWAHSSVQYYSWKKKGKDQKHRQAYQIKQNTTSKELCFSLILWVFFSTTKALKPSWHGLTPKAFQLISSFECVTKNCVQAQLESLWGEEGFVKQTWWSKIFDPFALPKVQGYGSIQMTSWVMDQTQYTESAISVRKGSFLSMLFESLLYIIGMLCFY